MTPSGGPGGYGRGNQGGGQWGQPPNAGNYNNAYGGYQG